MNISALSSDDDLPVFAIRIAPEASALAVVIYDRLAERNGSAAAEQWRENLRTAWASLATFPLRCAVADENDAFQQFQPGPLLRVLLFPSRRAAWRLLFTVHEATSDDPPFVQVHLIRHSAEAPLSEWPAEE